MGIKDTWAVKQLVMATQRLHASRLYERYSDNDFFLIHTPRLDEQVVAVIMGKGGETFGLNLFLGPTAQASYDALFYSHGEAEARMAVMRSHMLGYCMVEGMDLSFDARKWIKKAKVKPDRNRLYPDPMYIESGKVPTVALKDKQTHLLLHLTNGILAAAEDKHFKPCGQDRRGRVLAVSLTKDTESPRATIAWEQADSSASDTFHPVALTPTKDLLFGEPAATQVPFDLSSIEFSGDSWLVSMMPAPGYIEGDDRQPFVLLVCSEQTEGMWPCVVMGALGQAVVDQLAALMHGEPELPANHSDLPGQSLTPPPPGLPEQILVDSAALHDVLDLAFSPLGIDCHNGEDDPMMRDTFEQLRSVFGGSIGDGDFDDLFTGSFTDEPPAPGDIDGWKSIDGYIKDLVHTGFDDNPKYLGTRALARYFGPDADPMHLMVKYREIMAIDSYAFWFATQYRSTRKQPTLAETWLTDPDTPAPVKTLLKAIVDQAPSIYRIGEVDDETGKIEFHDIFTGEITIVTDFALSTCADPGMVLPGLLAPAGDFHLFYPAGPMMAGFRLSQALEYFTSERITPSPKTFREQPHLIGRLWSMMDQAQQHKPNLRNTDGDPLSPHTAVFACPDRQAVERFLEHRDGYEPEDEDTWNWFREGTVIPNFDTTDVDADNTRVCDTSQETNHGPVTLLGQIKLSDGKLTLTVNSRERMDAAKALLELIDGVALHSFEAQTAEALFAEAEHDATDPIDHFDDPADPENKMGPHLSDEEEVRAANAYIAEHYKRWLDMSNPILNDLTPRQAAQNPKLRNKVATMIRAIPDPTNLGGGGLRITTPREQMLAELGLD